MKRIVLEEHILARSLVLGLSSIACVAIAVGLLIWAAETTAAGWVAGWFWQSWNQFDASTALPWFFGSMGVIAVGVQFQNRIEEKRQFERDTLRLLRKLVAEREYD